MSNPTKATVDLRLVGPRTYANPYFFNRPVKRGEVVKDIPVERAQILLDQFSGDGDNKRFSWETVGKARGVKQNKAGNSQRSEIEYEDSGDAKPDNSAMEAELEAMRNQLKEAREAAAQAQAEAEAAKAEAEAAADKADAEEAAKVDTKANDDTAASGAEGKPAATARRSTRAAK